MQFLDPCNDVAFKRVFGSENHKNITISFLNSILEYTGEHAITSIEFKNNEQLPQTSEKKDTILDIICTDQIGRRFIVEMQVAPVKFFDRRMTFYAAKTYAMQLGKGKPYRDLMPVITVAIINFIKFSETEDYKSIHLILNKKTHTHDIQELAFAFVELPKFTKQAHQLETDEDKWIYLIKELKKQEAIPEPLAHDEFQEACNAFARMTWSEDELNAYDDAFVRQTDQEGSLELATEKGIALGIEKGIAQANHRLACKLLAQGLPLETIAQYTELSIEEIKILSNKK